MYKKTVIAFVSIYSMSIIIAIIVTGLICGIESDKKLEEIPVLQAQIAQYQKAQEDMTSEITRLNNVINLMENENSTSTVSKLAQELEAALLEIEEQKKTIKELEEALSKYENGESVSMAELVEVQEQLTTAKARIAELEESLKKYEKFGDISNVVSFYSVELDVDIISIENIERAVKMVSKQSVKSGNTFSLVSLLGDMEKFERDSDGNIHGLKYFVNAINKAVYDLGLRILEVHYTSDGYIEINTDKDFRFNNSSRDNLVIICDYSDKVLSVSLVKG